MPDFSVYQPPGVFVEEELNSLVNVIGVRPSVLAIVGPAVGYRTATEAVTLSGETLVRLDNLGIDDTTVVVTAQDGTVYVENTDYTLTSGPGEDTVADTADDTLDINRIDVGGSITDGETVFVSYQYTDPDYYDPYRVSDFDDVQDAYGPALDIENGAILSPLSFAAKIAFENGANELVLVATTGVSNSTDRTELSAAYAKLLPIYDIGVVVPLTVGMTGTDGDPQDTISLATDLDSHCVSASSDGKFRIGVVGYETSVTVDPTTIASGVASKRIMVAWPNTLHYYHGYTNQTLEVAGYYLAAAYGGRFMSIPAQMPLTRKRIFGFSGFPASVIQSATKTTKDAYSRGGVAVAEQTRQGTIWVRHGTMTAVSNIQNREASLVRARDALITLLDETVEGAELIGTYIDGDTPGQVKSVVAGVLETAVTTEVINDYNNLKVRQLVGDPSVIEVKFQYQPAYPLNYIVISFSINTQTGETTVLDQAA